MFQEDLLFSTVHDLKVDLTLNDEQWDAILFTQKCVSIDPKGGYYETSNFL